VDQKVAVTWGRKVVDLAPKGIALRVSAPPRVAKATARVPTVKAVDHVRKGIARVRKGREAVPLRVVKEIVHVPTEKPVDLARKGLRLVHALTRKRCGSNSIRTATAAYRRKKLPSE
jgi:hypothetical protein